jgi:hypothetical protein
MSLGGYVEFSEPASYRTGASSIAASLGRVPLIRTVMSSPAEAMRRPSGLYATA